MLMSNLFKDLRSVVQKYLFYVFDVQLKEGLNFTVSLTGR